MPERLILMFQRRWAFFDAGWRNKGAGLSPCCCMQVNHICTVLLIIRTPGFIVAAILRYIERSSDSQVQARNEARSITHPRQERF
jgi:hypothetical protein